MTNPNQDAAVPDSEQGAVEEAPKASFDELPGSLTGSDSAPLDTLLEVSLPVTIEFGRTQMSVQDVLQLGRGSVIQLDRVVGEPVDIYVTNRKLAEGEVVVIGEYFGVRLTALMGTKSDKGAPE